MTFSPIVELRQYTLLPGRRDELIALFEAQFIGSQERCGAKIIGTFRDLDDPTKFVWLRGFAGIDDRPRALGDFYGGPVWTRHRTAANATMVDSDDVLLLAPARDDTAFVLPPERFSRDGEDRGIVEATIVNLAEPADERFVDALRIEPGGELLGAFLTCEAENNFPILPVREGEHVAVWFVGYPSRASYDGAAERAISDLAPLVRPPHVLRLEPTRRSLLTGRAVQHAGEVS